MPLHGHPHPLLRRGRDYAATLPSSNSVVNKAIHRLLNRSISSLSLFGPRGSGKATAAANALVAVERKAAASFTSILWLETSSTTTSVAMLQHSLMHWIIELCPDLRKITSNSNVQFAPPTTVQEGEKLLQKMILDASILGVNFLYVLNECDNPFLPQELGLFGLNPQTCLIMTDSRIVANIANFLVIMPTIQREDVLFIMQSYDENISIIPMLAGMEEEEEIQLNADLILDKYKRSIQKKSTQMRDQKSSSRAVEKARELERVDILVDICSYPLMATMAAGALRHAERWSKKTATSSLENYLRRVERSVEEEKGVYYEVVEEKKMEMEKEKKKMEKMVKKEKNRKRVQWRSEMEQVEEVEEEEAANILAPPTMGNLVDANLESIPHLVRLCLFDIVHILGAPKTFPYKLAIEMWSMRIGGGAPECNGDDLFTFLRFLQLEEYTTALEREGVTLQLCISANAGIQESVARFVAWTSGATTVPSHCVRRLKDSVFKQCDLQDFVQARVLFGKYPSCFNVLTQLCDACLVQFDRGEKSLCVHDVVRTRMKKQLLSISGSSNVLSDSHARVLTCLRNSCCVANTWTPREGVDRDIASYFYRNIQRHLVGAGRRSEADALWFNFLFLKNWIISEGVVEVVAVAARSELSDGRLRNIVSALQASAHALSAGGGSSSGSSSGSNSGNHLATQLLARLDVHSVACAANGGGTRSVDQGRNLLRSAEEQAKECCDLSSVSASLGNIRERMRSKNIVRTMEGCGESDGLSKVRVVQNGIEGGAVVVGMTNDGLDQHLVVHSLDDGRRMERIKVDGGRNEIRDSRSRGSECVMVGVSPLFEYVVTSHLDGYLTVWETWNDTSMREDGVHSCFVLGLESGHTQHARSVDFNYARQAVKKRRPASISVYASMNEEREEREERKDKKNNKNVSRRRLPTFMVTAGNDGEIIVWNLKQRCIVQRTSLSGGVAEDVVFTSGGNSGSGGCDLREESIGEVCFVVGNILHLWNLETGNVDSCKLPKDDVGTHLRVVRLRLSETSSACVSRLVVGFFSGSLLCCDTSMRRMVHQSKRIGTKETKHRGPLTSLSVAGNVDGILTSCQEDREIKMWSVGRRELLHQIKVEDGACWAGVVSKWSICVGTNPIRGTLHVLDVAKPPDDDHDEEEEEETTCVVSMREDGTKEIVRGHGGYQVTCVHISKSTFVAVSSSFDGRVCVWCTRTGRLLHSMKEKNWVSTTSVCCNDDGNVVVTGSTCQVGSTKNWTRPCITVWRLKWNPLIPGRRRRSTKNRKQSMQIQIVLDTFAADGVVHCLSFCRDGVHALSATSDYQIRLWNFGGGPKMGTMEMRYTCQPSEIHRLASSGGERAMKYVEAESIDGSFRKWYMSTGIKVVDVAGGSSTFVRMLCSMVAGCDGGGGGDGGGGNNESKSADDVLILDSSRRIYCWSLEEDVLEEKNLMESEKDTNSFASLAAWSDVNGIDRTRKLVWSKQKKVWLRPFSFHREAAAENTTTSVAATTTLALLGMKDAISALTISSDGFHVLAGSHEGEILWWNLHEVNFGLDLDHDQAKNTTTEASNVQLTRRIRKVNTETNSTVQNLSISKNSKTCVIVTWDEYFVYRLHDGSILGKRPVDSFFVTYAQILENDIVLLVGDDHLRLWTLSPEDEVIGKDDEEEGKKKKSEVKKKVRNSIKTYEGYESAFAPKMSDECTSMAVNEPNQNVFVLGFGDGSLCSWRRRCTSVHATTLLPGGLPISAISINSEGTEVVACSGTMAYRVLLARPKCNILMKIPLRRWMPPTSPTFLTKQPTSVVLHTTVETTETTETTETAVEKRQEMFYIDRGDRVDATDVKMHQGKPIVVLGTKEGRVHILRRGGRVEIDPKDSYVEPPPPPTVEPINLKLTSLLQIYHVEETEEKNEYVVYFEDNEEEEKKKKQKQKQQEGAGKHEKGKEEERWATKLKTNFMYWSIGKLRNLGMTIWPYNHSFPGVSKFLRPTQYRRLQKLQTKRNLKLMQIYLLLMAALLLVVAFFFSIAAYLFFVPPVRSISKLGRSSLLNISNTTNATTTAEMEIQCYDSTTITNQTQLWSLGNRSMLCDCADYEKETECLAGTGLSNPPAASECVWESEIRGEETCTNVIVKTCVDVPPTKGESCLMYRGFGKCGASFMVGYCCQTCFKCEC